MNQPISASQGVERPEAKYPGGENAPGYKLALQVWMALFMLTICVGLLNFLGSYLKSMW
jgi:hypothetical protein